MWINKYQSWYGKYRDPSPAPTIHPTLGTAMTIIPFSGAPRQWQFQNLPIQLPKKM